MMGRFTSPDVPFADQVADEPQSLNLYSYVTNNPLRYIDPLGLWRTTPEGFIVWENSDDTWESLAALLGTTPKALQNFFPNVQLGEGTVLDFANFNSNRGKDPSLRVEWDEFDEAEYQRRRFKAEFDEFLEEYDFQPPMGGGIKVVTGATFNALTRTGADSRELVKALAQQGLRAGEEEAAHHVVAIAGGRAAGYARAVLARFGIGLNSAENGVILSSFFHQGLHTTKYYRAVSNLLAQCTTKEEVIQVLDHIKSELTKGTFPH